MADGALDSALERYRRRHRRALAGHHFLMSDFASGRPLNALERTMFAAAACDDAMARHLYDYGSRQIGPLRFLSPPALAQAASVNLRHRQAAPERRPQLVA